jgi:hypothetical protein
VRPHVAERRTVPVTACRGTGMPNWTGALTALGGVLSSKECADAELSIILSNHFARYQVIPWQDELQDESELIEFSRRSMRNAYGHDLAQWSLAMSLDRAGRPFVVSAVERLLLDELDACVVAQKRRLVSVRPLLMEAFNWARTWLNNAYQWLVIVEEGMICASLVGKGGWAVARSLRVRSDWPSEVVAMLEREQLLVDEAEKAQTVFLHVVNGHRVELPSNQWTIRHLDTPLTDHTRASELLCAR